MYEVSAWRARSSSDRSVATDVVLLLAGISPNVLVFLGPFTIAHSAFVHANLKWTLGPLRYVLAGPHTRVTALGDTLSVRIGNAGMVLSPGDVVMALGLAGFVQGRMRGATPS